MDSKLTKEERQQSNVDFVVNSVLGFLPGGHIVTEIVEYRAKVQQERLNKFSDFLKKGFETCTDKSFDPETLKTEEFLDAFEAIIRKVASTSSEQKLKRYRNVLLRTMYEKNDSELFFKYLALIDEISETQILILSTLGHGGGGIEESEMMRQLSNPDDFADYAKNLLQLSLFTLANGQKIKTTEIDFFIHDLESKGIIENKNRGIIKQTFTGETPVPKKFSLTEIGSDFLEFIKEYGA